MAARIQGTGFRRLIRKKESEVGAQATWQSQMQKEKRVSEAPVPLMMAITSNRSAINKFRKAVEMCVALLSRAVECLKIGGKPIFYFM
jgi:hypothetical protein